MSETEKDRRYVILTEGEDNQRNNCVVLPGACRVVSPTSIIPVTQGFDHEKLIGSAYDFARAGVIDGEARITFTVRLSKESGLTHDDLSRLKPGTHLTNVFKFRQPGHHLDWVTDGIIREISFYDPNPSGLRLED